MRTIVLLPTMDIPSVGEDVENQNPLCIAGMDGKRFSCPRTQRGFSSQI